MQSLIAELDSVARRDGQRLHSVQSGTSLSFEGFASSTHQVAHAMRAAGLQAGDRIGVWSRNDVRMLQVIYGAMRCQALFIPLNARNSVGENLALMHRFDCKGLFMQAGLCGRELLASKVPSLRCAVTFDPEDGEAAAFDAWRDAARDAGPFPDLFFAASDAAAIFPTSGTTGEPKGVLHNHLGLATMARGYRDVLTIEQGSRHLVVGPLTHVAGGVVYASTGLGCSQHFLESTRPADILDAIEREQANLLFVPPTLLYGMLDEQQRRPRRMDSLTALMYAGSSISPGRLQQAMEVFGPVLVNVYSQSELLYPVSSLSRLDHARIARGDAHLLTSAGQATAQGEISIMDDTGQHLPAGETGEIVTRSLAGMHGFVGDAAATESLRGGGWHHTGDLGRLDAEGFLYIVDRKKDMIITGGFNVYSREVEVVLQDHAAVEEVAVVGVPDEKWGEAVCAVVVLRPGSTITPEALRMYCRERLGGVKAPKRVVFREKLPHNSAGKILKRDLRDQIGKGLA